MEQKSRPPPSVAPRNPGAFRVMGPPGTLSVPQSFVSNPPPYPGLKVNGSVSEQTYTSLLQAEREVEILNHCFDDIEFFMGKLQKSAEAHSVLNQRKKKKKSQRKKEEEDDLLTLRARPPTEDEFNDIFQKFKYSFSLLDRLKFSITNPNSEELLHHIFIALDLIVKTTGGPAMGATVSSPALTSGAVTLLQDNLTEEEKQLWTLLGPNWTLPSSQLSETVSPYTPVFMDAWKPEAFDAEGQLWEDPIESQHKKEALRQSQKHAEQQKSPGQSNDEMDFCDLPPEGERMYCCSYDFVARNSSELSVLQGETLEVVESSKRWWKCRNRYDQIGFVPFNILEPLSALNDTHNGIPITHRPSKKVPLSPLTNKYFSYAPPSPLSISSDPSGLNFHSNPTTPTGEDSDRVMVMNDELLQRLANGRTSSSRALVIPRTNDTSAPLDYHSPPPEVEEWLRGKGFSKPTVQCLGVLTGAQLFSLNKDELRAVSPEEGARVYSQIMVLKALLEDVRKATELEAVMEKQKMKVDLKLESGTL
ncbi:hypothetical protein AAFF_G00365800 [Aldrovandia affinis]|uniref:SH3 domain-containing protein n=1 Tax=Aldrovandia affinis TaxID=143900 RepID=A0AAD7SHA5_9TELE|nr:hypothetical protein AAFF_G00365800 [Aldrovandia affinis]